MTHVAGTRMIRQGTDGISCGWMNQGVSLGENMLRHCPWDKTALDAAPNLLEEVKHLINSPLTILQSKGFGTY